MNIYTHTYWNRIKIFLIANVVGFWVSVVCLYCYYHVILPVDNIRYGFGLRVILHSYPLLSGILFPGLFFLYLIVDALIARVSHVRMHYVLIVMLLLSGLFWFVVGNIFIAFQHI